MTATFSQIDHPVTGEGVTVDYLNQLRAISNQPADIVAVDVHDAKTYGDGMASTAGRVLFKAEYAAGADRAAPQRMMLKIARTDDDVMAPFYSNEVSFYTRLRPQLPIEAPLCLGGHYDPASRRLGLLLEDLTARGATFPNVLTPVTLDGIRSLLDVLAPLHARFWNADFSGAEFEWLGTALDGEVATVLNDAAAPYIQHEIDHQAFKGELVSRLGWTGAELREGVLAVHRHQQKLDQCLVHGDTHIGNCYFLPDGTGGLLDWQLTCRGHPMHDVSYIIVTGLSTADRRVHEGELLRYYLDRLKAAGVGDAPSFEDSWTEYRRSQVWNLYVGWLTTPVVNYGWEICVVNHLRIVAAFEDLDSGRLVREVL